jgi:hypothetical protein
MTKTEELISLVDSGNFTKQQLEDAFIAVCAERWQRHPFDTATNQLTVSRFAQQKARAIADDIVSWTLDDEKT